MLVLRNLTAQEPMSLWGFAQKWYKYLYHFMREAQQTPMLNGRKTRGGFC
jgi:hypothetical protein